MAKEREPSRIGPVIADVSLTYFSLAIPGSSGLLTSVSFITTNPQSVLELLLDGVCLSTVGIFGTVTDEALPATIVQGWMFSWLLCV